MKDIKKKKNNNALKNINQVQNASKIMVLKKLWVPVSLNDDKLSEKLKNNQTLAIGKTIYEQLTGNLVNGSPHYVLIQKRYSPTQWKIHDPGLPPIIDRKVPVTVAGNSMFGDLLLVYGIK